MRQPVSKNMIVSGLFSYEPKLIRQVFLVFTTNLLHLNCGYGIGFSSPCLSQMVKEEFFSQESSSWFASTLVIGQVFGSVLGPVLADRIGRRKGCAIAAFFSITGWAIMGLSSVEWMLFAGRVLTGFFDCLSIPVAIMYVSEASETNLRGSFINSSAIASGLGIALAYFTGTVFYWRYACAFPIVLSGLSLLLISFCQESPVFLLTQNKPALESLQWYREISEATKENDLEIESELKNLEFESSSFGQGFKESLKSLLQGSNLRAFLILFGLFFLYPLTGMYSITFFAIDLFKKLDLGSAETVAIISALMRCLGTSLSSFLVYKYGRRKIMLVSTTLVCITIGLVGVFVVFKEGNFGISDTLTSWILIILIFTFMFFVGVSVPIMPWVLMAEWFTPDLKSLVSGCLLTLQFFLIFVAVQTTNPIIQMVGNSGLFIYFCAVCAIKTVFIAVFVPETHGKLFSSVN